MPSATPYDRQFSFALYSAENPLVPHSGVSLDAEFNAVKLSLDETQQNIRLIQDDDGVLKRGSVGRAQLDSSITIGFAAPSSWQASTTYDADVSTVFYASKFYICTDTHVSGVVFEASHWQLIADFTVAAIIDDGSITSVKLADGAVAANKIADGSISNSKLASGAVSTSKLAALSVTVDKIASFDLLLNALLPAGLGPLPWSLPTLPTGWDWADGGTLLSDTNYPTLRSNYIAAGFPHGQDGSGNPKKPDMRGRVVAGMDNFGLTGNAARISAAMSGTTFGATGGSPNTILGQGNLPASSYVLAGTAATIAVTTTRSDLMVATTGIGIAQVGGPLDNPVVRAGGVFATAVNSSGSYTPAGSIGPLGAAGAFNLLQPTMVLPMIIKAH